MNHVLFYCGFQVVVEGPVGCFFAVVFVKRNPFFLAVILDVAEAVVEASVVELRFGLGEEDEVSFRVLVQVGEGCGLFLGKVIDSHWGSFRNVILVRFCGFGYSAKGSAVTGQKNRPKSESWCTPLPPKSGALNLAACSTRAP